MKQTAVEWLIRILEGQKDKPFDYQEWQIAFEYALELEKRHAKIACIDKLIELVKNKTDEKDNTNNNNSNSRLHL